MMRKRQILSLRLPQLLLRLAGAALPLWLAGCAVVNSPGAGPAPVPAQWFAPLPHNGRLTDLRSWWQQQNDALLVELIDAAQAASPTIASALSRIEQARATRTAAGAALLPTLDASVGASRGRTQPGFGSGAAPITSSAQAGLQAAWEIDLFGGNRAAAGAAAERMLGTQAQWHDARVSVAAEVVNQYDALRSCRQLAGITRADANSRQETARLTDLSTGAGFTAPATAALARASAAEARARATQQAAQCEIDLKALVALTALQEPELRQKLAAAGAPRFQADMMSIATVPADALAQRPDVFSAEREVAAASADIGAARAQLYPRLGLNGSIGIAGFRSGGLTSDLQTWSIGPLALSLPLFDGGRRAANVDAAQARYQEAAALYRARVRHAVREVEEALVNLQSSGARDADARIAVDGYRASFNGTEARYRNGLASLVELEDARRFLLTAEITLASLQRERLAAGVALYRALGGGWTPALIDLSGNARSRPMAHTTP